METLGNRIKRKRLEIGFGLKEFAKICGISHQTLIDYESNEYLPDIKKLQIISEKLKVSCEYLINGSKTIYEEVPSKYYNACIAIHYLLNEGIFKYSNKSNIMHTIYLESNDNKIKRFILDYLVFAKKNKEDFNNETFEKFIKIIAADYRD